MGHNSIIAVQENGNRCFGPTALLLYNQDMPEPNKVEVKCPICKKGVAANGEDLPFCSERCRLIDLGKWASGQYVVSSPVHDLSDEMEDSQHGNVDDED